MNPMALQVAHGGASPGSASADEAEAEAQTSRIMSEMGNISPEVRARAAHLVAGVASTGFMGLKVLLRSGIISRLTAMVCDGAAEVRDAAVSALRNCGIRGGDPVWTQMVQADVMTTLLAALFQQPLCRTLLPAAPPARADWEAHPDLLAETCQLLDLLWSIGESSAEAVRRFNAAGLPLLHPLVAFAAGCGGEAVTAAAAAAAKQAALDSAAAASGHTASADASAGQTALAVSAAQTLHVLSEENPQVCAAISGPLLAMLQGAVSNLATPTMVGVLTVGVLLNLGAESQAPEMADGFQSVLGAALDGQHCADALAMLPALNAQAERAAAAREGAQAEGDAAAVAAGGAAAAGDGRLGGGAELDGMNRKERRQAAKGMVKAVGGGGEGVAAVAHGDFNEAFLHTEGIAGEAAVALGAWEDRVMASQVALQIMTNMLSSAAEAAGDDEGWVEAEDEGGNVCVCTQSIYHPCIHESIHPCIHASSIHRCIHTNIHACIWKQRTRVVTAAMMGWMAGWRKALSWCPALIWRSG